MPMMGTAKQYFLTQCVRPTNVHVTQGFQAQVIKETVYRLFSVIYYTRP